jgi:hypothetical protein
MSSRWQVVTGRVTPGAQSHGSNDLQGIRDRFLILILLGFRL